MKRMAIAVLLASGLWGCQAHMMETHGDSVSLVDLAKGVKPARGGVIRYLNTGRESWRKARRTNAESQMKQFCKGGPYTITAEGPRSQFGADMPIGKSVTVEVDEYWYIRFECPAKP